MALTSASPVQRQVARVRRRLFLQTLVRALVWSWTAALALSAVWLLLQPLLIADAPAWLRWAVLGGAAAAGTAAAVTVAVMRKPSPVEAALALDRQFRLKERVTTSLLLRPDEASSSAGAALLADANQRVDPLRVGDRFPVRVPWTACLVPACVVVLVLLIYFYHPNFGQAKPPEQQVAANTDAMKAEIDKVRQQLQAKRDAKKKAEGPKSPELKKIEAEIDKMLSNPHDTKDQVREDIKKGDDILDEIKKQEQERVDQARALKEQLQQMERARKKEEQAKREEGPAKDLAKAMDQGNLAAAKQEADDLARKLEANEQADELRKKLDDKNLTPKEKQDLRDELKKKEEEGLSKDDREKLEQQLKDLKDDADDLARKNEDDEKKKDDDEKKLDDAAKKGEIDKDQLQAEKAQLEKDKDQLQKQQQNLKDLGQKLQETQQAMKEGKDGQAAQKMQEAGDKLGKMDGGGEQKQLAQDMQQVQQMKKALSQALAKQEGQAQGDQQANQQGNGQGDKKGNGQGPSGPNQGGLGSGARPEGPDGKTGEEEHKAPSDTDDSGRLQIVDHVNGPQDRFQGPRKPADMTDEIRKAAQEGAAASERERLTDRATADMARGFFEKMRPPDKPDKDDKKPAPPKP